MENQKKPLLISFSRTPKTNPKFQVFAFYGRKHMVFVCDFLCVFAKFVQKSLTWHKNQVKVTQNLAQRWCKAHVNASMFQLYQFEQY